MASLIYLFVHLLFIQLAAASEENEVCLKQKQNIVDLLSSTASAQRDFLSEFIFLNDTRAALLLTWTGLNNKTLIAATMSPLYNSDSAVSNVYRSTDDGHSFYSITGQLLSVSQMPHLLLLVHNGLQRNPADPKRIYLVSKSANTTGRHDIHVSLDSGATWHVANLPFYVTEQFQFHETRPELVFAKSGPALFASKDGGFQWSMIADRVIKASWASLSDTEPSSIYLLRKGPSDGNATSGNSLLKSPDLGSTWRRLPAADGAFGFVVRASVVLASRPAGSAFPGLRRLEVSADFGATFRPAGDLPAVPRGRAVSVLDVDEEGAVVVRVDAEPDSRLGCPDCGDVFVTSPNAPTEFALSLDRQVSASRFCRLGSTPGAYLATVARAGSSGLRTLVTLDRGAVWEPLVDSQGRELMLATLETGALESPAEPCVSTAAAPGLALIHASTVGVSGPLGLFVSNDGARTWLPTPMSGPHLVTIGNGGGVIAAVAAAGSEPQRTVWFSTDAGGCWHNWTFAAGDFSVTGLLSEPGSRASSVAIWGYSSSRRHWHTVTLDFAVLAGNRTCDLADREVACAMGGKRVQLPGLRKGAAPCLVTRTSPSTSPSPSPSAVRPCPCTATDFGCSFGFRRRPGSRDCVPDPGADAREACADPAALNRSLEMGLRRLPGNACQGGFLPNMTQLPRWIMQSDICQSLLRSPELPHQDPQLLTSAAAVPQQQLGLSPADSHAVKRHLLGILLPLCIILPTIFATVLLVRAASKRFRTRQLQNRMPRVRCHLQAHAPTCGESDVSVGNGDTDWLIVLESGSVHSG